MFVEIVRLMIVLFLTTAGIELSTSVSDAEFAVLIGVTLGASVGYAVGGVVGRSLARAMGRVERTALPYSIAELFAGAIAAMFGGGLGLVIGAPALIVMPRLWGLGILVASSWPSPPSVVASGRDEAANSGLSWGWRPRHFPMPVVSAKLQLRIPIFSTPVPF